MQINLFVHEPFDLTSNDDPASSVWHDYCIECAADVTGGEAQCRLCDSI